MKLWMFCLVFVAPLLGFSQQEQLGTPEERAAKMTDSLQIRLPLYEGQYDDFYKLNLKYAQIIQKEVFDKNLNKISAYYKIYNINSRKEEELFPMMDTDQQASYELLKKEAIQRLMNRFF